MLKALEHVVHHGMKGADALALFQDTAA